MLVKQVPDTANITGQAMKDDGTVNRAALPAIFNPEDLNALEMALQIKEQHGGKITIVSAGGAGVDKVVKHALSMGADEGLVLSDDAFQNADSMATAHILASAAKKIGEYDLILCGRQAADWDEGLTGTLIAHELDLPLVTLAKDIEVGGDKLTVTRVILDGYQKFAVSMPALVTVSNEVGQPRLPSGWGASPGAWAPT